MLGKQIFHDDLKKIFEPFTKTIADASEDVTKTIMITSKKNNLALENINDKLLEKLNDRGIIAFFCLLYQKSVILIMKVNLN